VLFKGIVLKLLICLTLRPFTMPVPLSAQCALSMTTFS
jgi:hypothetical protein